VCLAEAAIHSGSGATLDVRDDPVELFGEVGGRAVLTCAPEAIEELQELAGEAGVMTRRIGTVGGDTLFGIEVSRLRDAWQSGSES
jgi:phosphoribosylformylglycinamidine (FGAM) synthase-like enzyme